MSNQARVGLLTTASVAIFIFGFYFLKGKNLWERKDYYYAVYDRIDGLYKSNLVLVNGYPVGRVEDMDMNPDNYHIVIKIEINKGMKIPANSVAELISTDLLGQKVVRIDLGGSKGYLEPGDTLITFFETGLSEQFTPIADKVNMMLPKLDTTLQGLQILFTANNPTGVIAAVAKLNATIDDIRATVGSVNALIASNQKSIDATMKNVESISANFEKNNDNITKIMSNFGSISDSLQQANLKQTLLELSATVTQLKILLDDVNQGKGTLGKVVKQDELYNHIDSTIASLDYLLKDVKNRPYRYINVSVFGNKKREERIEKKYNESGK